jgi:hypothetical protein
MSITRICHDGASSGDDGQHQIPEGDVDTATLPVFTFATSAVMERDVANKTQSLTSVTWTGHSMNRRVLRW